MISPITLLLSIAAAGQAGHTIQTPAKPPSIKVRVTQVVADGTMKETQQELKIATFKGDYYCGDGLGLNLRLRLQDEGKFECKWTGCLGEYGSSSGTWELQPTGVRLVAKQSDGMLKERPIERLSVISLEGHYLLQRDDRSEFFQRFGPNPLTSFHRDEARKTLGDHYYKQFEKVSKEKSKDPTT